MSLSAAEIFTTVATISIGGTDLPTTWYDALLELRVELEYRVPGRATLRFLDDGYALVSSPTARLGADVTIGARRPGTTSDDVLLEGQVTGIAVEQSAVNQPELVLTVHDKAHLLARGTTVKSYLQATYADVVRQLASANGLRPEVDACPIVFDYVLQADSPLGMLDAMADRVGYDWWVDKDTLHFHKPGGGPRAGTTVRLVLGQNLASFSVRASGMHVDAVRVDGWDRTSQRDISATAQASASSLRPDSSMFADFVSPSGKLGKSATLITSQPVQSHSEAQEVANALRDAAVASAVTASGTVVHGSQLRPGVKVQVADAGPTSGSYVVTRVEHVFRDGFLTRFVAGDRRPANLVATLGSQGPLVDAISHHGLVVGEVTNINDKTQSGRILVRFPGVDNELESGWARPLTLGAGSSRGLVVLPEVGDEVLVGFEGGDLRQPVILGGLYGDKAKVPLWDVANGQVSGRRFTSRLGHVVELKDGTAPAEQYVLLQLQGDKHLIKLAKDKLDIAVPSGVPLSIKVGESASLVFDAAGSLKVKAVNISFEAEGTLTLKSNGPAKLESSAMMEIKGQLTSVKGSLVEVQSSGPATIKGTPVAIN